MLFFAFCKISCQRLQNALPARRSRSGVWGLPQQVKSGWVAPRHCLRLLISLATTYFSCILQLLVILTASVENTTTA